MTILIDWQLKELCEKGLLMPYEKALINPSSIDVRIGNTVLVEKENEEDLIEYDLTNYSESYPFILKPGHFLLVATLETINLPLNCAGEIKLKSSIARRGVSHALAGWIDNGYSGIITLELHNISRFQKFKLYPGLRIGQLKVYDTLFPEKGYNGKYQNADKVLQAK